MGVQVTNGALLTCSFGVAPATLVVPPDTGVLAGEEPAATIEDAIPLVNIPTFGMCSSLANPEVASATSAALGVLTPMPCVPVTEAWAPGAPTVLIGGLPALTDESQCICAYGGVIEITFPGQVTVETA